MAHFATWLEITRSLKHEPDTWTEDVLLKHESGVWISYPLFELPRVCSPHEVKFGVVLGMLLGGYIRRWKALQVRKSMQGILK